MDNDTRIALGAASNQAGFALQGIWKAFFQGDLNLEQISKLHADLTTEFFNNRQTIESSYGLAAEFQGTTQASPQEAQQAYQGQQSQAGQGFTPANVVPGPGAGQPPVQQAPGVPQQQPQPDPFPQQQAPQGQNFQPAPAPGAAPAKPSEEQLWHEYFNNPKDWYDNRQKKATGEWKPGAPDFTNKQDRDNKKLWLHGNYGKAPDWVFQRLGYAPGTY